MYEKAKSGLVISENCFRASLIFLGPLPDPEFCPPLVQICAWYTWRNQ